MSTSSRFGVRNLVASWQYAYYSVAIDAFFVFQKDI
jgi:hypothetical protein